MEQFLAVAVAHFLALLIPGADFFLIARTALSHGRRRASGICLGIAAANGVLIAATFSGLALVSEPTVLAVVQLAGGVFLLSIGVAFLRSAPGPEPAPGAAITRGSWGRSLGLGLASGLLNPKNALFYLSLASVLAGDPPIVLLGYGVWMFGIVLAWDLIIATAFGSPRALARLGRIVPVLTRVAGAFLLVFGLVMIVTVLMRWPG